MSQKHTPRPAWHEDPSRYVRWKIANMQNGDTFPVDDVLIVRADSARYDIIDSYGYGQRTIIGHTGHCSQQMVAQVQADVYAALGLDAAQEVA